MVLPKGQSEVKEAQPYSAANWPSRSPSNTGTGDITLSGVSKTLDQHSSGQKFSRTPIPDKTGSGDKRESMTVPPGFSNFNNPLIPIIAPVPWTQELDHAFSSSSEMSREASDVEATINRMTKDLERFQLTSPPPEVLPPNIPPAGTRTSPSPEPSIGRQGSISSENTIICRQKNRSRLTCTRRHENRYENRRDNVVDENQMVYRDLDDQRRQLTLRKAACIFLYGALRIQGDRVRQLRSQVNGKTEECAARIILHNLILNLYRKSQRQLQQISGDNQQLEKSVENLCLQLRVVRHLQSAEKERTIEKAHEITSLKSEVNYVKKQLSKAKSELERIEKECEAAQLSNEKIHEEKTKFQRELRSVEDRKEILQGSLGLERKRSEKYITDIRALKRTINELRLQITDLISQSDGWQERARTFEAKNWEFQLLLESRAKEFTDLGRHRDALKFQYDDMKDENDKLFKRNSELERNLRVNHKETLKLKKTLTVSEAELKRQLGRIGYLENAVVDIRKESTIMRAELMDHKLKNLRRRRAWVALFMAFTQPFQTIINYVNGDSSCGSSNESGKKPGSRSNSNATT